MNFGHNVFTDEMSDEFDTGNGGSKTWSPHLKIVNTQVVTFFIRIYYIFIIIHMGHVETKPRSPGL